MGIRRMKQSIILLLAIGFINSIACAGEETRASKELVGSQACPQWYRDNEWNVGLWGTYAVTEKDYRHDRYLRDDHAWGGGLDAKYFFCRYFGLGIEAYVLDAERTSRDLEGFFFIDQPRQFLGIEQRTKERRAVGSVLGTLTVRYPIACSRIAPYAFAGGGAIFGGGEQDIFYFPNIPVPNEVAVATRHTGSKSDPVGQFGAGVEVRLTPHIGIVNDFTWNVINGKNNNFGMARTGINFAF
jgi:hypothetical protein